MKWQYGCREQILIRRVEPWMGNDEISSIPAARAQPPWIFSQPMRLAEPIAKDGLPGDSTPWHVRSVISHPSLASPWQQPQQRGRFRGQRDVTKSVPTRWRFDGGVRWWYGAFETAVTHQPSAQPTASPMLPLPRAVLHQTPDRSARAQLLPGEQSTPVSSVPPAKRNDPMADFCSDALRAGRRRAP